MTRRRWIALAAAVALLLLLGRIVAEGVVEYRWYAAFGSGARAVWRARAADLLLLRAACAGAAALLLFANLYGVAASVDKVILPRRLGDLEIGETVPGRRLLGAGAVIALVLGMLLALPMDDWMTVDLLRAGPAFGEIEPFTGRDLSFFVYWLPLERALYAWALLALVTGTALVVFLYALTPGLRWERGGVRVSGHVRRHLSVLGVGLLLLLAWGHRLDAYELLAEGSGRSGAFTAIDEAVGIPIRFALGVITALAALVVLRAGWAGQARVAFWVVTVVLVGTFVARALAPALAAQLMPAARVAAQDRALAATRALLTQRAYAVDAIRPAPPGYGLDSLALLASAVAVWDPAALVPAVERARPAGVLVGEVGWRPTDARLTAVLVERPERDATAPAAAALPEWTVVVVDATRAAPDGAPIPLDEPDATLADAGRSVPILVAPEAVGPAVVSDPEQAIVGDPADGWGVRVAHAWARRDLRLAFTRALDAIDAPELVLRRDVRERVAALAPFFVQGGAITPALAGDTLWWVVHLYSARGSYPHSQRYDLAGARHAYFRHAGVALVDARSGAVRLVPAREPDVLTRAWLRRFPGLFTDAAALPAELAAAVPPPGDAVLVQAWALAQYGARGEAPPAHRRLTGGASGDSALALTARAPALLPTSPSAGDAATSDDTLGVAPATTRVQGWTLPLLDASDRTTGMLVALGGVEARTLWAPAGATAPRWRELLDRLTRAGIPAREVLAPGDERTTATARAEGAAGAGGVQRDAAAPRPAAPRELQRGRVRAVPVRGLPVFVQPVYARGRDGAPDLTRVAVLAGDSVRAGATLADAITGASPRADVVGAAPTTDAERVARARAQLGAMRDALRRGDWGGFGRAFDALGQALQERAAAPR